MNDTDSGKTVDTGLVFEIQKLSTEDGPGIRTTVFLKECPLHCAWCHNPESISKIPSIQWFKTKCIGCESCVAICPNSAIKFDKKNGIKINRSKCKACGTCVKECPSTALQIFGIWWSVDNLYKEIAKDKSYYDNSEGGITLSGGEPTIQLPYILSFLQKCKDNGISTAIETCGYTSNTSLEKLFPYLDLFLYDIKEIDPNKHKEFTGVSNERILENAIWLIEKIQQYNRDSSPKKQMWIRTPLIPGFTATNENVSGIARFIIEKMYNAIDRWDLLAFNNLAEGKYTRMDQEWKLKGISLLNEKKMEEFVNLASSLGVRNVHWSGFASKEEKK